MSFESANVTKCACVPADASLHQELYASLRADLALDLRQSILTPAQTLENTVSRVAGYMALGASLCGAALLLQSFVL